MKRNLKPASKRTLRLITSSVQHDRMITCVSGWKLQKCDKRHKKNMKGNLFITGTCTNEVRIY
jgi:hypothetical protein